ncbi:hypothetical protein AUK22_11565 [bacterium CG2_30_54_10]|nr:MAG: hypothetical protein AUK22_11565 [bacterium CG2_30_54_10]
MNRLFSRSAKTILAIVIFTAVANSLLANPPEPGPLRLRYMGSSCFSAPTGFVGSEMSFIIDDSRNLTLITQPVWGKFIELSYLRHLSGDFSGKNVMNFKVNILEEGTYIPNVVWGVSDFNTELGSKIFFFAGSKTIEAFGATLHAGYYKDPKTTDKKIFFGLEKTILPLAVIAGERLGDETTIGMKFRPYPGVSIEYARRSDGTADQANIYKATYLRKF